MTKLAITYEDEYLLAVHKAHKVHSVPLKQKNSVNTLVHQALACYPALQQLSLNTNECGLLHRLDFETSGIMLFAKTAAVFEKMQRAMKMQQVKKEYLACVLLPQNETGQASKTWHALLKGKRAINRLAQLDAPAIEKAVLAGSKQHGFTFTSKFVAYGPGRKQVRVVMPVDETRRFKKQNRPTKKNYSTLCYPLQRWDGFALLYVCIDQGFRHQIRAHLAFQGTPIVGDELYAPEPYAFKAPRMLLHAYALEFSHPILERSVRLVAELPQSYLAVLQELA